MRPELSVRSQAMCVLDVTRMKVRSRDVVTSVQFRRAHVRECLCRLGKRVLHRGQLLFGFLGHYCATIKGIYLVAILQV